MKNMEMFDVMFPLTNILTLVLCAIVPISLIFGGVLCFSPKFRRYLQLLTTIYAFTAVVGWLVFLYFNHLWDYQMHMAVKKGAYGEVGGWLSFLRPLASYLALAMTLACAIALGLELLHCAKSRRSGCA